jgi:septal ring factor EnvC (AmiA/AmiB activator)
VLITIKEQGYDPRRIVSKIRTIENLETSKLRLDKDVAQAKDELDSITRETHRVQVQLKAKQKRLDEAKRLEATNLRVEDSQAVRNAVVTIATRNGLTPQQALRLLQEDIIKNYDKILSLEPTLNNLTRRKEKLEAAIKA